VIKIDIVIKHLEMEEIYSMYLLDQGWNMDDMGWGLGSVVGDYAETAQVDKATSFAVVTVTAGRTWRSPPFGGAISNLY
jgi:hypothetical protein